MAQSRRILRLELAVRTDHRRADVKLASELIVVWLTVEQIDLSIKINRALTVWVICVLLPKRLNLNEMS